MLQHLIPLTTLHPYLTLFLSPVILFLLLSLYRLYLSPLSSIPGPLFPRLSHLWLYYHSYIGTECRTIHALHLRYGPVVCISPADVSISSGKALNTIYVAKGGFLKADCYKNFDIDGHRSIFSALDPKHRAPRAKAVVAMFATGAIREKAMGTIEACAEGFVQRLKEAKAKGVRCNVLELARSLAVDAVTGYLFCMRYGGLEERKKQNSQSKKEESGLSAGAFVDAFVAVGRFFLLPNSVFLLLEKLAAKFFPDPSVDASMTTVDAFVAEAVRLARDTIDASEAEDTYQRRLLQAGFSESETIAQCKDLIFAGTDSTGMNLATACWHLAKNQDILETLHTELTTTTPPPTYPLNPTTYPHLHATLQETLRISMANPTRLPRVVPSLPDGGIDILGHHLPTGTVVGCAPYSLHFDADVFPEPFEFRPRRWLNDPIPEVGDADSEKPGTRKDMITSYIPFGLGPRQCIARNLATAELEVALRCVVRSRVLEGARAEGEGIEILEWFNSKVVGEAIWIGFG